MLIFDGLLEITRF